MYLYCKPIVGISTIRSERFLKSLHEFKEELARTGYNPHVTRLYLHSIAHFGIWLEREGLDIERVDNGIVAAFEQHRERCLCENASKNTGRHVVSGIRIFVGYLRKLGCVTAVEASPPPVPIVAEFLNWMRTHRGVVETTIRAYQYYVANLVESLGDDPKTYVAADLRDFISKRYGHYGPRSIRMVMGAVRMFLRYLVVDGRCRSGLDHALISSPNWSQQSLPRGISSEDINKVLMSCPATSIGIRDRAILLLLIRLGLRAGDVAKLRFGDICFKTGVLRVCGKGFRETQLPLSQDIGEALLEYLRAVRIQVKSDHDYIFLQAMAPFLAFGSQRHPGSAIRHVARSALKRAGVQSPSRGSHVFRHTAACQMLRSDVGLENIAAVLRHRVVDTTAIYAKVDLQMLAQVAQPWPEMMPC